MSLTWIYFRLWYFPFFVIRRMFEEVYDYSRPEANHEVLKQSADILFCFLSILALLHIFWFYLMAKGLKKRSKNWSNVSLKSPEN